METPDLIPFFLPDNEWPFVATYQGKEFPARLLDLGTFEIWNTTGETIPEGAAITFRKVALPVTG